MVVEPIKELEGIKIPSNPEVEVTTTPEVKTETLEEKEEGIFPFVFSCG